MNDPVIMSDDQFTRLIERVSRNQEDHDLLIEIRTLLTSEKETALHQRQMCHENFGNNKATVIKAHERIDKLQAVYLPVLVVLVLALIAAMKFI